VTALVKARPKLFEPFEGAVLIAGDESGTLTLALRILTDHFTREYKRRLRIRLALGYPVFFGLLAAFALPFAVLPKSPVKTYVTVISGLLLAFLLVGGVLIGILASVMLNSAALTRARFARVLASCFEAGLPAGRAVRLAVDASGSVRLREHVKKRSERELTTTPVAKLFEGCDEVPQALLGAMMIADATGDYRGVLTRYAADLEAAQK
jgi:type II secretory pathway component PulF